MAEEQVISECKAEIEAQAEADKQSLVYEKQADLNAINRIIARVEAKAEAERLALEEAELPELEG